MIAGGKLISVEAKREKDDPISGLSINIGLDDVKTKGQDVEIKYTYTVNYAEGVGFLKIIGEIYAREETKLCAEIDKTWKANRRLPNEFAEVVLNAINFTCGSNGTLVVRPINLSPPMIPPKIEISSGKQM